MAKKRKLEVKSEAESQPQPQPNPEPEIQSEPDAEITDAELTNGPTGAEDEIAPEQEIPGGEDEIAPEQEIPGAEDEILPEEELKPQILPEATKPELEREIPSATTGAEAGNVVSSADAEAGNVTSSSATEAQDDDEPEPVQKLLEPMSKDQLFELLCDAATRHTDVMDEVRRTADVDPVHRKVFVHGLGWDTNAENLASVFRQYGEIEDCNAVRDKISGKSKGYGFILFKHRSGARKALKEPQKQIGSRMTACQLASAGPVPPPAPPVSEYTQRKIYVSNVSADLDPQKLLQFFAKYGEIEDGPLGLDKMTGKPKGFALFVYKTPESAKKALEEPHKNFEGHILHCQKAIDGPKPTKLGFHSQHGTGFHHPQHGTGVGRGALGTHFPRAENASFAGGMGSHVPQSVPGHMMAPPHSGLGFNQGTSPAAAAIAGINPALGQALTALLTTPGAGLGLTNLLGSLGSTGMMGSVVNQAVPGPMVNSGAHPMQGGYGNQTAGVGSNMNPGIMGGYGGQTPMQGGYNTTTMGQGTAGRGHQGVGHMGGVNPYMGH